MQKELQTKHLEITEITLDEFKDKILAESEYYAKVVPMFHYKKLDKIILSYPTKQIEINLCNLNDEMEKEVNDILEQKGDNL